MQWRVKYTVGLQQSQQEQCKAGLPLGQGWYGLSRSGWKWLKLVRHGWIFPILFSCCFQGDLAWELPLTGWSQWLDRHGVEEYQHLVSQDRGHQHLPTEVPDGPAIGQGRRNAIPKPWAGLWGWWWRVVTPMISVIIFSLPLELLAQFFEDRYSEANHNVKAKE